MAHNTQFKAKIQTSLFKMLNELSCSKQDDEEAG